MDYLIFYIYILFKINYSFDSGVNYINNGIIALIDKSKIIIYENCDD